MLLTLVKFGHKRVQNKTHSKTISKYVFAILLNVFPIKIQILIVLKPFPAFQTPPRNHPQQNPTFSPGVEWAGKLKEFYRDVFSAVIWS